MSTSTTIAPARPRLVRRAAVAMSLTAALAGGTLVAGAGTASAAPGTNSSVSGELATTEPKSADVDVKQSRKSARQSKGSTRPTFTVTARSAGTPVNGWVKVYVRGQKAGAKKLGANGTVTFRPSLSTYHVGSNKVAFKVTPSRATGLEAAKKVRRVKVKPKAAPNVTLATSRSVGTKGKSGTRPKYTVKAAKWGESVRGRAHLYVKGDKVATKTLRQGKATFRPGWNKYKVGKNTVRVRVAPSGNSGLHQVNRSKKVTAKAKQNRGQKVVRVAHKYVGHRYSYGGGSPRTGFDCSGFTSYVYKKATGKTLPRSSSAQRSAGKKVSRSKAKKGDIVYTPGHVAIYAGNGRIIEAARPGVGVVKRKMWQDNPTFIRV